MWYIIQKELLEKAKAEQKPLKEQLAKQGVRVNSLSASLHDKEKLVKRVTEENEELVRPFLCQYHNSAKFETRGNVLNLAL
jgi:hypothetical protein